MVLVQMEKYENLTSELLSFIDASPSCFHVVANMAKMLEEKGFERLYEEQQWQVKPGRNYYVIRKDSSIIAVKVPAKELSEVYIAAAHSDSPTFKIKVNPTMVCEGHYTKLNTEKYGGMIMSTWMDRPLSVAGRVVVEEEGHLVSRLVNVDRDLLLIPSVAIHMNREVNNGMKFDAQVDTIPLLGDETGEAAFIGLIAESAGVEETSILGSDLYLYVREKGKRWGASGEFISARALDDLQCAYGCLAGFLEAPDSCNRLELCCVFDNEEVGSLTGQGADSTFLSDVLCRVREALGYEESVLLRAIAAGYMVSADNAHAVHPNHPEYADPTNRPYLNQGIVIKYHASQKYTTDGISEAKFRQVCRQAKVPVQTYTNKSNLPGGSTLGNLANRHISIPTLDIGLPQLAMHSAYETAGAADIVYLAKAMECFFGNLF